MITDAAPRMGRGSLLAGLALCAAILPGPFGAALAQDVARDPFTPPSMEERIKVADENRIERLTEQFIRDEIGRLEKRILQKTEGIVRSHDAESGNSIEDVQAMIFERMDTMEARIDAAPPPGGAGAQALGAVDEDTQNFIESLSFVACVDGRALYRDQQGSTFFSEVMDALDSNSRCNG